jgi:soluble lytic murein transglycosylase
MFKKILAIVAVLFVTSGYAAAADYDFSSLGISSNDKEIARKALAASQKGDWQGARQIAERASDRLIYKVILWREFKEARTTSSRDIMEFLDGNNNWPLRDRFKNRIGIPTPVSDPNDGWRNLASKARDYIEAGQYARAYSTIKGSYENLSEANRADALWLSGWINLRFLKNPAKAAWYFETMFQGVRLPISKSRAAYWAGRSYEALGNDERAQQWYKIGAEHFTWYYGQLSALKLNKAYTLSLPDYPPPDYIDAKNFLGDERIRAAKILDELGDSDNARLFLVTYMQEEGRTVSDYLLIVLLAQQTTNYEWAVMAGKKAAEYGVHIPHANYPILSYTPPAPEKALMMAIIRQESMLNRFARSPVGAAGMMQLMPSTAKNVAAMMGVNYSPEMLWDKEYNMSLGSYYLAKRIDDFNGSYILAIASYNAGIGNVLKWIKRFGDPRRMNPDEVVDWIESIPFMETRNYVQRVTESIGVYRARLNNGSYQLLLLDDLRR